MTRRLLAALLALPALAACGSEEPYPIDHAGPQELPSGDFVAAGLPAPFGAGDLLRATFEDGQVSFQATCNSMSGSVVLKGDVLTVSRVGGTEMGCPGAGHEQDEWLVDFFTSRPTLETLDLGFSLRGELAEVRLLPPEAVAGEDDVPLESVVWQLTGIEETAGGTVSMSPVREGTGASLDITGTRIVLETGCNTASATGYLGDGEVEITEMLVTQRGCPADRRDQERLQLAALDGDVSWSIDGDQLRLGNDRVVLLYAAGR